MSYRNPLHGLDSNGDVERPEPVAPRGKTIAQMTAEIAELNTRLGWRETTNTVGEFTALLHSEISEMLEAWRVRKMAPFTTSDGKPDDVASECADVLIRLLDMCDVLRVDLPILWPKLTLDEVPGRHRGEFEHRPRFGDAVELLHWRAAQFHHGGHWRWAVELLGSLLGFCEVHEVDLEAEYERKMAYNRTRPYQHGGKVL
jgi:NTP pyrophosphatase (non-canonical NTP hydrolase)